MLHLCPVCGYPELEDPPDPGTVCPCCGTEFGYDDEDRDTAELRQRWLKDGARWWSPDVPAPPGWAPVAQLRNVGYTPTASELSRIAARRQ